MVKSFLSPSLSVDGVAFKWSLNGSDTAKYFIFHNEFIFIGIQASRQQARGFRKKSIQKTDRRELMNTFNINK
ncbi:hypothetical protein [Olivibacter jilunii]|uniref:hypothetical protein n=1 Tax=Olivibacter jilunii TaxID=985016 RepID=UPI003F184D42